MRHLSRYAKLIERLDWPRERLSVGPFEGDSPDDTFAVAQAMLPRLGARTRRAHRRLLVIERRLEVQPLTTAQLRGLEGKLRTDDQT